MVVKFPAGQALPIEPVRGRSLLCLPPNPAPDVDVDVNAPEDRWAKEEARTKGAAGFAPSLKPFVPPMDDGAPVAPGSAAVTGEPSSKSI